LLRGARGREEPQRRGCEVTVPSVRVLVRHARPGRGGGRRQQALAARAHGSERRRGPITRFWVLWGAWAAGSNAPVRASATSTSANATRQAPTARRRSSPRLGSPRARARGAPVKHGVVDAGHRRSSPPTPPAAYSSSYCCCGAPGSMGGGSGASSKRSNPPALLHGHHQPRRDPTASSTSAANSCRLLSLPRLLSLLRPLRQRWPFSYSCPPSLRGRPAGAAARNPSGCSSGASWSSPRARRRSRRRTRAPRRRRNGNRPAPPVAEPPPQ